MRYFKEIVLPTTSKPSCWNNLFKTSHWSDMWSFSRVHKLVFIDYGLHPAVNGPNFRTLPVLIYKTDNPARSFSTFTDSVPYPFHLLYHTSSVFSNLARSLFFFKPFHYICYIKYGSKISHSTRSYAIFNNLWVNHAAHDLHAIYW